MDENLSQLLPYKKGLKRLIVEHGDDAVGSYFDVIEKQTTTMSMEAVQAIRKFMPRQLQELDISHNLAHTADHIGIINHPFFWSAKASNNSLNILVLATSNISPSNSSHPRGLTWHNRQLQEQRAHFIPLSWRRHAMYGIPAVSPQQLDKFIVKLPEILAVGLSEIKDSDAIKNATWLSEQIAIFNEYLWSQAFGDEQKLIYIELESVVNELLIKALRKKSGHIYSLFTDSSIRHKYLELFDGIVGAHTANTAQGSELFWLMDHQTQKRVRVFVFGNELRANDGATISLTAESLTKNLEDRTLLPTLALSYSVLAAEHNVTLGGGFSQIDYLPQLITAWSKLFSLENTTRGDIFSGEIGLISLRNKNDHVLATLADILLYTKDLQQRKELIKFSNSQTLQSGIEAISDLLLHIANPRATVVKPPETLGVLDV